MVTFPEYADAALGIYVMKGTEFEVFYGIYVLLLSVVIIFQTLQRQIKQIYERHEEMAQGEREKLHRKMNMHSPSVALNGTAGVK